MRLISCLSVFSLVLGIAACGGDKPAPQEGSEGALENGARSAIDEPACKLDSSYLQAAGIAPALLARVRESLRRVGVDIGRGLDDFDALAPAAKQEVLWQLHLASAEESAQPYRPTAATDLREALTIDVRELAKSMSRTCDLYPKPKTKIVHAYGAIAKAQLKITNPDAGYTGIFKTGSPALLRLSLASPVANDSGFTPALAIKFPIQNAPSENLVVMRNLDGQIDAQGRPDHRLFRDSWANEFGPPRDPKMELLRQVFDGALRLLKSLGAEPSNVFYRSLWYSAGVRGGAIAAGESARVPDDQVRAPRDIILRPTVDNAAATSADPNVDFRDKLAALAAGDVLFDVYVKGSYQRGALVEGKDPENVPGDAIKIGQLVLESAFSASSFGDRVLFFQHRL